jgi:hypothetical protein
LRPTRRTASPAESLSIAGLRRAAIAIVRSCGHGSYLRSKRGNDALGLLCSLFTFTPTRIGAASTRSITAAGTTSIGGTGAAATSIPPA